ncbi:TPA: polysaccharide biosynthesis tyrosine autokinase CpsD [Streptococcus pneumoniae]|nr:polysaccharide biosynthesis tyrosine autokinase CpsD [Streptococcus pneumoniae]
MPTLEIAQKKLEFVKKAEEYYNALCTNIQLSGDKLKVISVTSVNPEEGKTTTSVNIARSFARAGYKTLLIDGDTRNSVMSGFFKSREKITGLTEFLSGTADLSHGLCDTNIENLFVVQSGTVSPNPTALLQSKNFNDMIETLRKYFDYIIVDTAPIGIVIDAAIITQKCDASILVTATGEVNKRDVQKAKQQLEQTGKLFLGVVLNKLDISVDKYGVYGLYGNYGKKNNLGKILWMKKD